MRQGFQVVSPFTHGCDGRCFFRRAFEQQLRLSARDSKGSLRDYSIFASPRVRVGTRSLFDYRADVGLYLKKFEARVLVVAVKMPLVKPYVDDHFGWQP